MERLALFARETDSTLRWSEQDLWRLSVESSKQMRLIGGLFAKDGDGSRGHFDFCLPAVFVPDIGVLMANF